MMYNFVAGKFLCINNLYDGPFQITSRQVAEDKEFSGVLKKEHVEIPGVIQGSGISSGVFKKNPCGISMGLGF